MQQGQALQDRLQEVVRERLLVVVVPALILGQVEEAPVLVWAACLAEGAVPLPWAQALVAQALAAAPAAIPLGMAAVAVAGAAPVARARQSPAA